MFKVKFWGVRGSVPAPLSGPEVEAKFKGVHDWLFKNPGAFWSEAPFWMRSTYGGNTTCVEAICGNRRFILDMGTGVRPLGNSLFKEMFEKGLDITFLLSHVHWDHIQGLPFFGPLYVNKKTAQNRFQFLGGLDWMQSIESCLRGQMDPPLFPVSFREIERIVEHIEFQGIHDLMTLEFDDNMPNGQGNKIYVSCGKLNHPNETYGWRIEYKGGIFAFTTDNEPFDPTVPDPRLKKLAEGADVWATDCQYTRDVYNGIGGVPRHGWGHSYPEAVVATALQAKAKMVILTHHDPASSDELVHSIERNAKKLLADAGSIIDVSAAHEGLVVDLL